jgi:hypothetical protein
VGLEFEAVGGEGIGFDDARTGAQVLLVYAGDHVGVGEVSPGIGMSETDAALVQERAHSTVSDENPPFQ